MKTVRVDFSEGLRDGLVCASVRRASDDLAIGDEVLAFDLEEDMEFTGTVRRFSDDGRLVYLEMDWQDADVGRSTFVYDLVFRLAHDIAMKDTTSYHEAAAAVLMTGAGHTPSEALAQQHARRGAVYQEFLVFVEEGAHSRAWARFSPDSAEAEVGAEQQLEMTFAR